MLPNTEKRVLITGATGNVGRACSCIAAEYGNWHILNISRAAHGVDLTNWEKLEHFLKPCSPFDLVIMTHGVQQASLLLDLNEDAWNNVIDNNLKASMILTNVLMRLNKINMDGMIIYFSSIQATQPRAGRGAYAIAKAGIEALAKIAAVENQHLGIRSVALRIGQMTETMQGVTFQQKDWDSISNRIHMPLVAPRDIAKLCFQLYYQPSLTGTVIEIASGHSLNIW